MRGHHLADVALCLGIRRHAGKADHRILARVVCRKRERQVSLEEIDWLSRLRQGLEKTRQGFVTGLLENLGDDPLTPEVLDDLETLLLRADAGVTATDQVLEALRQRMNQDVVDPSEGIRFLKEQLRGLLDAPIRSSGVDLLAPERGRLNIWLMVGVNGVGKTTTTVGLGDALKHIGKNVAICLREPSLGPVFGMKGGAAGGGYAQVVPMDEMNLHFTGDFHAITSAHSLLAAMLDNHINWGNALGIDNRRISWRRVVDMNDRALRDIVVSLGGLGNGFARQDGFDITVASEVMAIFCLASDMRDLEQRLGNIVVAETRDRTPITARELNADGAMTVLLKASVRTKVYLYFQNRFPEVLHKVLLIYHYQ